MKKYVSIIIAVLIAAAVLLCSCSQAGNAYSDSMPGNAAESYYDSFASESPNSANEGKTEQKLIKSYKVQAESKEYDKAVSFLDNAVSEAGGYYENRREHSSGNVRYLTAVVRVPADKAEGFAEGLRGAANVTDMYKTAQNVTEAYIDTEARLESLEAERQSLINMMASLDKASEFDFWYKLQTRISETEQEIASLKAKIKNYDNLVSYATLDITLYEVKEFTESEDDPFVKRISDAFRQSWKSFGDGCKDFAVFFVRAFPTLLTLSVIGLVIFLAIFLPIRAASKRKRKAGQAK